MTIRSLVIGAMLLTATPVFAQSQAAKNDPMWNVFLKLYPQRALKAHEEGAVGFLVTLNNKGDVTNCQVTQSSGHPILDEETCKLITLNAVFKPDPNLSPSQTKTSPGVITWKLPDSTTQLAAPQASYDWIVESDTKFRDQTVGAIEKAIGEYQAPQR